jgi:hypothetical protein
METKITEHYFEYGTLKYFRGAAENLVFCAYGRKRDPLGAKAYLEVQNKVKPEYLEGRVRCATTVAINWEDATAAEVETSGVLKYFSLDSKLAVNGSYMKAKSAKLRLIKFVIDEGPLQTMLNQDADIARNYLANEGGDGRIVSGLWVATEEELAEHFSASGSISTSANAALGGLDVTAVVTAAGGKDVSQTITLLSDTPFAYQLHKVTDWNRDKTRIEGMKADYHS